MFMSEASVGEINVDPSPKPETIIDLYGIRKDRLIINGKELTDFHPDQKDFIDALATDDGEKLMASLISVDELFGHFNTIMTETDNRNDLIKETSLVASTEMSSLNDRLMNTDKILIPSFELLTEMGKFDTLSGFYIYYETKLHEAGHFLDGLTKAGNINPDDFGVYTEVRQNYFSLQVLKLISQRNDLPKADIDKVKGLAIETQNFLTHVGVRGLEPETSINVL